MKKMKKNYTPNCKGIIVNRRLQIQSVRKFPQHVHTLEKSLHFPIVNFPKIKTPLSN